MSKSKKGAKPHSEDTGWDEELINEKLYDDYWRPFLMILVPDSAEADLPLQALEGVVKNGNRKKFTCISKKDILLTAQEDAKLSRATSGGGGGGKKSKQGSTPVVFKPLHVQVCEHVVNATSSGEPLSPSLTARMIKYMILKRRTKEIAEKRALAEGSDPDLKKEEGKKKSGSTSGRTSKTGGKRGKETPVATEAAPTVAMPSKVSTTMKKRGDEDLDSKYLHDEPETGPNCYCILTGFNSTELLKNFAPIKLKADALVKVVANKDGTPGVETATPSKNEVSGEENTEGKDVNQTIRKFWLNIDGVVRISPSGSMLRDMARLEIALKSRSLPSSEVERREFCQDMFDDLAEGGYQLLEQYAQYQHYLEQLDVVTLSQDHAETPPINQDKPDLPSVDTTATMTPMVPEPDMRYYNEILREIPEDKISIPIIIHSMAEQVSVTLGESSCYQGPSSTNNFNPVTVEFGNMMEHLSLSSEDKQALGVKIEPEISEEIQEQIIIPSGDEVTKRSIGLHRSSANFEEKVIKTAGLNSFLSLTPSSDPDLNACIHTLNQLLHTHEKLTVTKFNHFLVLLSLENLCLQTASTPPVHNFVKPVVLPLLYDHPFDLKLVTDESSVVTFSSFDYSNWPTHLSSQKLQLDSPLRNLEDYSDLEVFEFNGLLQELRSLQFTHPYVEIFQHQHSESIILVVHTGFDGTPVHKHKLSSHTHTKVGFQNYLQFVCERYGGQIDEAVERNRIRRAEYEEEKKVAAAQRLKDAEQRQKEMLTTLEEEQGIDSGKTRKSVASHPTTKSVKKGVISSISDTPASSISDFHRGETLMQPFQVEKPFTGYDMGDVVLLKESVHTTLFTGDGVQVQSMRHLTTDGAPEPCDISLLHNGHRVVCTQVWASDNSPPATDASANQPTNTVVPQPPPEFKSAMLKACFNSSLHISCSYYGPKGNGEFPYLPYRPKILEQPQQSDHLQLPGTQPGVSPKLSKKQQEHQQQLLEQQRVQEALLEKEREVARAIYQQQYDILVRNYKYQQLTISTEYGLQVQCHVSLDHEADPVVTDPGVADEVNVEGSIIIKQQYSHPETVAHLNEHASKERFRFYHPDGYVIKCMKNDTVTILCADGSRYCSATPKEAELFASHKATVQDGTQPHGGKDDLEKDKPDIEKGVKRVTSAAKLRSSVSATKLKGAEKDKVIPSPVPPTIAPVPGPQTKVWAMTTASGSRYLIEVIGETPTCSLSPEPTLTPDPENKENIEPAPSPTKPKSVVIPLSSIHLLKATDPVTKEVYITREDKIVTVKRPDGSYVSEFEDGTRFTVSAVQDEDETSSLSEITIECVGFSQVTYRVASQECSLLFADDTVITCSNQGAYTVLREGDYELCIESTGKAQYKIPNAPNAVYVMDHTNIDSCFHGIDSQGNTFSLKSNSEATVDAANPIEHAAFAPCYFQLTPNRLGFQLHKASAVAELIAKAESNPKVAVVKESVPNEPAITSTTLIEPVLIQSTPPTVASLWDSSIVPYNLRNGEFVPPSMVVPHRGDKKLKFGSLVGKGLEIGSFNNQHPKSVSIVPPGLKYRQFLHMPPSDGDTRQDIHDVLTSYVIDRHERMTKSENMLPTEQREPLEVGLAESLNMKFMELNMGEVYASAMSSKRKQSFQPVPPSMSQEGVEFIEKSKEELEVAEDSKVALRHRDIPPYFESKYAQPYLPLDPPDMSYLTSQLAHPPERVVTKSPYTTQSSSLTLTMDESDSLFQGEGPSATTKSPTTTSRRHTHPGPKSTLDTMTCPSRPTDKRPTNPTPMKAVVIDDMSLHRQSSPDKEAPSSPLASTLLDVTGQPREKAVPQPSVLLGGRPGEKKNKQYTTIEEPVRRKVFTSSSIAAASKLQGFEVIPEEVNFGMLREGSTYTFKFNLKNTGIELSHFKIKQPPPSTGIKVVYNPGPVAAGLVRQVTIELFAMAVGAVGEQGAGHIYHQLEIITQPTILHLPIRANVLTSGLYNSQQPPPTLAQGVERSTVATRKSVTRPLKKQEQNTVHL